VQKPVQPRAQSSWPRWIRTFITGSKVAPSARAVRPWQAARRYGWSATFAGVVTGVKAICPVPT
jgi:hypothetical protein